MLAKPIHAELKPLFQSIYKRGKQRAREKFAALKKDLAASDHFNQLLLLNQEDEKTNQLIEDFEHPYYIKNTEETLLNYFASRTYLLSVDESGVLEEAIFLDAYDRILYEAIKPLRADVPQFSYARFISGETCPYYQHLPKEFVTDKDNYFAINDWQAAQLQKVVWHDFQFLAGTLEALASDLAEPLPFLAELNKSIVSFLDESKLDNATVKDRLAGLGFLPGEFLVKLHAEVINEELGYFRRFDLHLKSISPTSFGNALKLVEDGFTGFAGNELCLVYSLDQLAGWLEDIEKGLDWTASVTEPDWRELIDETRVAATEEMDRLTEAMEAVAYDEDRAQSEIGSYLIAEFEKYRAQFNAFPHKWLFSLMRDDEDSKAHIDRVMTTNSFFGRNSEINLKLLQDALVLSGMIWVSVQIYAGVFETHRIEFPDNDTSHFAVMSLLSTMVPDKELYQAMNDSLTDAVAHHESYFLPFDVFMQNHKENFHHIFYRAVERLQTILDDSEPSNKILYLQTRLKELRQRELKIAEFTDDEREFGTYDDRYSTYFKDFLGIEAEFIAQVKEVNFQSPLQLTHAPLKRLNAAPGFDELFTGEQAAFLLNLLERNGITREGKWVISQRKKGALRGVVEALLEDRLLPAASLDQLCRTIAGHIGLDLRSKLDHSQVSEDFRKAAKSFIKANNQAG
jgi:hypothetical protein